MHNSHISVKKYTNQCKDMKWILSLGMAQTTKIKYSYPKVQDNKQWVELPLDDPSIRIIEGDYDSQAIYHLGHITSTIPLEYKNDITYSIPRDLLSANSYKKIIYSNLERHTSIFM